MEAESRKRFQVIMGILMVLVFIRLGFILYQRHESDKPAEKKASTYSSDMDVYVMPPKIHPYDLKSAKKEMAGKTVWVKAGNSVRYYPFSSTTQTADLKREKGLLPPLAVLQIKDVILQRIPAGALAEGQVAVVQKEPLAVFQMGDAGVFAVPIGKSSGDDIEFTVNDLFFFSDPHQLYKHWPPDTWQAIDNHQAKQGMNEIQVALALGTSATGSGEYGNRTLEFDNNGHPVTVSFANNKATSVTEAHK